MTDKIVMQHTAPVSDTPLILHREEDPKPDPQPQPEPQPQEVTVTTTVKPPAEKPDKE